MFALALALGLSLISCVKRSNHQAALASDSVAPFRNHPERININAAPSSELEKLPAIGRGLAERVIDHREKYGAFRRPEHLIIVRGISDRRFRGLRDLITVE